MEAALLSVRRESRREGRTIVKLSPRRKTPLRPLGSMRITRAGTGQWSMFVVGLKRERSRFKEEWRDENEMVESRVGGGTGFGPPRRRRSGARRPGRPWKR